jgi:hypothetical protein
MSHQPDITAVLAWAARVVQDARYLQAAARGEPVPALSITSTPDLAAAQASPASPYGSTVRGPKIIPVQPHYPYGRSKHGRYDAASAAEVAEGVEPEGHNGRVLPGVMTAAEVATAFRTDQKSVIRWAKAGTLRSFKTPGVTGHGHHRFYRAEVEALMAGRPLTRHELDALVRGDL